MFTSSLCDISVAAKDKTLLRNKLGHLDRIELDCLLIRVLPRFFNAAFPHIIFS